MKKNILFIGGSTGIGLETIRLVQHDYNVYVASRNKENLKDLNISHIQYDATTSDFNDELVPEVLHGFVYLPGSINLRPFRSIKSTTFEEDLNINFLSMVKILQKVINNLKKSGNSSIVLYSTSSNIGLAFQIADDLLDKDGDETVMGKPIKQDDKNETPNFVTILGRDKATKRALEASNSAISTIENFGYGIENLVSLAKYTVNRNH